MNILEKLRAERAAKLAERATLIAAMEAASKPAETRGDDLTAEETTAFDAARAKVTALDTELEPVNERIGELEAIDERTKAAARYSKEIYVPRKTDPRDILEDRSATPGQLADALTRSVETRLGSNPEAMQRVREVSLRHSRNRDWARQCIVRASEDYTEGWVKLMTDRKDDWTTEERTSMSVGSNADGGYLVPIFIDPTIILTNAGTSNAIRALARNVELTVGNVWHGVTTAGVTASWAAELTEVADGTPTDFGQPTIPLIRAQAFVQASIEAFEDIGSLTTDIAMLFADARERLEGAAHATGSGNTQPKGVFTAVHAVTTSRVVSTTGAAIGLVDLDALYYGMQVRYRARSTFVMNPLYETKVKDLGTAISASYSGNLPDAPTGRILGRPVVPSDDAPTTQTTTALDDEIILGDFSQYVIVDKPGSFAVEFIPNMFNTANNLPDGRRGFYAHWRTGADCSNVGAFRLLVDKTTA